MNEKIDVQKIAEGFDSLSYILDDELATVLFLMMRLEKPLLLEGNPGVGKTEIARVLAQYLGTEVIRLQCYEGLDVHTAVYEWNYQKQLLSIKLQEQSNKSALEKEEHIFGEEFLLQRPLLKAISNPERSPVLLIDEIDRADEEFEAFLLELLSAFQISIPEMGTIKAKHKPLVILTSNRTRELSDALKRRCLYHWVEYPEFDKEVRIVQKHLGNIETDIITNIVRVVQHLRTLKLQKTPGIAESIDWAQSLLALGYKDLDAKAMDQTLGCILKSSDDIKSIKKGGIEELLQQI